MLMICNWVGRHFGLVIQTPSYPTTDSACEQYGPSDSSAMGTDTNNVGYKS